MIRSIDSYKLQIHFSQCILLQALLPSAKGYRELKDLDTLEMGFNTIATITNHSFSMLHNLHWLELKFNDIAMIEKHAWSGLVNLKYLGLEGNKLKSIDVSGLTNLKTIKAKGNRNLGINDLHGFREGSFGTYSYRYMPCLTSGHCERGTVYNT